MPPNDSPLKQRRLEQGLRQADVAEQADCSVGLVSMMEAGYPSTERMRERVAAAVGASTGSFWPTETAA